VNEAESVPRFSFLGAGAHRCAPAQEKSEKLFKIRLYGPASTARAMKTNMGLFDINGWRSCALVFLIIHKPEA
jgi:hypothetical protein